MTCWKQKADDVLTARDLADVQLSVGKGRLRWKETHLMWRKDVLAIALAKHAFEEINAVYLKRLGTGSQ
jgi:hypothetical protein